MLFSWTYLQPSSPAALIISGRSSLSVGSPPLNWTRVLRGITKDDISSLIFSSVISGPFFLSAKQKRQFKLQRSVTSSKVQQVLLLCSGHRPFFAQYSGQRSFLRVTAGSVSPYHERMSLLFFHMRTE